jgi:peptidoglycan/LPS O-acetylase OafA/YrhL
MQSRSRNVLIDWLRGLSILMVAASHGALTFPNYLTSPIAGLVKGYFGVSLFFVISGFLITRNTFLRYASLENVNIGQFYVMRIARIIPPLLLFLATALLFFMVRNSDFVPADHTLVWSGVYSAITFQFHSFYLTGNVPGMYAWSPLWSLSIEEIFYFIFPVMCFLSIRTWVFVVVCAALIVYGTMGAAGIFRTIQFLGKCRSTCLGMFGSNRRTSFFAQHNRADPCPLHFSNWCLDRLADYHLYGSRGSANLGPFHYWHWHRSVSHWCMHGSKI